MIGKSGVVENQFPHPKVIANPGRKDRLDEVEGALRNQWYFRDSGQVTNFVGLDSMAQSGLMSRYRRKFQSSVARNITAVARLVKLPSFGNTHTTD